MNFDTQQLYLGTLKASTTNRWLSLSQVDRRRHMYVIGQTGSGKSTLLNNCILQDVLSGRGFAFIDPHGDSAELIIESSSWCAEAFAGGGYGQPNSRFSIHLASFLGATDGAYPFQHNCRPDRLSRKFKHFTFGYSQNVDG